MRSKFREKGLLSTCSMMKPSSGEECVKGLRRANIRGGSTKRSTRWQFA